LVQSILIFTLGFLAAALLALMVAPAIWRRAVYLTRKRIEAALPLTANELNAEKDKLRAEHAMAVRRVEMRVRKLREEGASQKIAFEEQADKLRKVEKELAESAANGVRLEGELDDLTGRYHEQTTNLSEISILLESTRTELEIRTDELKSANRELRERARLLEEKDQELEAAARRMEVYKTEIAERDAYIETLKTTIKGLKETRKQLQREINTSQTEGRATGDMLKTERKRFAQMEAKLEQSIAQISVLEEKLERREKELKRAREQGGISETEFQALEGRALAAEKDREKQEKQIAEMTTRIDRLMSATFGEKEQGAMFEELQAKMAQQSVAMKTLEAERDRLKQELASATTGETGGGDAELREKLNQLAAEVVAMAARLEGPQSRINTLLADETMPPPGGVISLAERIKALQRSANAQRNSA
jgi:chromosome segregation ATPase